MATPAHPPHPSLRRRALLGAPLAALLAGCSTPLPLTLPTSPAAAAAAARARLTASAGVHGWEAWRTLADINIGYDGAWRPLINRIQPEVVDATFRGSSQERLLPAQGINAQLYRGPQDKNRTKQVFWRRGSVAAPEGELLLRYDGTESNSTALKTAAALVAEAYGFFLLGPLWALDRIERGLGMALEVSGTERVNGRLCDRIEIVLRPGLGVVALDRASLLIDRDDGITRRLRFTLEGFPGTRGAVAEVDTFEHRRLFGVLWPMRSYEEVVHPLRLPAHDWFITGLDVNRGYGADALHEAGFGGAAAAPARAV
jgi:hypothetical protein